jgi:hypothetical protein
MANEMARLCYALNIDTWEVIRAAATKPFGFMPFYPGPGSAVTAFRSIRTISRGRRASTVSIRASSVSRRKSTRACPSTWSNSLPTGLNDERKGDEWLESVAARRRL